MQSCGLLQPANEQTERFRTWKGIVESVPFYQNLIKKNNDMILETVKVRVKRLNRIGVVVKYALNYYWFHVRFADNTVIQCHFSDIEIINNKKNLPKK